jgi:hypothetical protein
MRSPLYVLCVSLAMKGHGQAACLPTRAAGCPGSGCGHHSDGPAFFSLTRVKFDNMSFCLRSGWKNRRAVWLTLK